MSFNALFNFRTLSLRSLPLSKGIPFLFLPVGIGLLFQIALAPSLTQRLLAIALTLFCPELALMAWVDLKNIETLTDPQALSTETADSQKSATEETDPSVKEVLRMQSVKRFRAVTVSTVALEATGFYLSLISLPLGALVINASQLWFNLLANIQIYPDKTPSVVPCAISNRKVIVAVNIITTGLLCLWPIASMRLGLALALLTLVTLYLMTKYVFLNSSQ